MYPHEIKQYIADRNGVLKPGEVNFVTDIELHPQINHIIYNPCDNSYDMWDNIGTFYHFIVQSEN